MASVVNLSMDQGTYWSYQFTYEDAAGNPIDLTGYEAQMQARPSVGDSTVSFSLATAGSTEVTSPTGTITLGGAAGTILLELSAAATAAISADTDTSFVYDLELVPANGKTIRLVQGNISFSPEVTR